MAAVPSVPNTQSTLTQQITNLQGPAILTYALSNPYSIITSLLSICTLQVSYNGEVIDTYIVPMDDSDIYATRTAAFTALADGPLMFSLACLYNPSANEDFAELLIDDVSIMTTSATNTLCSGDTTTTTTTAVTTTPTTTTTTATTTTTTTTTTACTPPAVSGYYDDSLYHIVYTQYFSGSRYIENTDNPGNDAPPATTTFTVSAPATTNVPSCPPDEPSEEAIQICANFAINNPGEYYSFDIHYLSSEQLWQCIAYYDPNTDTSYFNVPDSDATIVYGYSLADD